MIRPVLTGVTLTAVAALMLATAPAARAQDGQEPLSPAAVARETARSQDALEQLLADYEAFLRLSDPIGAGFEGDRDALARLPDISRPAEMARRGQLQGLVRRAEGINADYLDHDGKLNLAYVLYLTRREVERINLDTARLAFDSEGGPHQLLAYLASTTRISNQADAEAWLARLGAAPGYMDAGMANSRRGLETGLVQARSVVESALGQARRDLEAPVRDDVLMAPFKALPDTISPQVQADLRARAEALVAGPITARRQAWLDLLQNDYLPKAPVEPGLVHRPGGKALYAFKVRSHTTTDLTPDQVHAIGQHEVARIRARMETEMREAGWTGSFADFLTFLRTDPQFYARTPDELLMVSAWVAKRADGQIGRLIGKLPRRNFTIIPVPEALAPFYTAGRGGLEACQMNTYDLPSRPLYNIPALTLHECAPGHSFQAALAEEQADGPAFRRYTYFSGYGEGWGLYTEFLGVEMGIYRTPYEHFGRLSYEMWRAARLVIDTGIHLKGWSRDQAIDYLASHTALSRHEVETEVDRYISWPGQALSYKLGELTIRRLRAEAEAALGERFDPRPFHDTILALGSVPLTTLEEEVRAFIARGGVAEDAAGKEAAPLP